MSVNDLFKMEGLFWKTVNYIIFFGCIFATIGLSIYAISRFCQNEDITLVKSSTYHSSEERIYPSISLCLLPPFIENEFDKFDDYAINMSSYIKFLEGDIWDARMLEVDYDEVTVSLAKNLLNSYFVTQDDKKREWVPVYYTSFRSSKRKCFTIDAPYIEKELLYYFVMDISNDIFPNGRRSATNEISTYLHYPGQRLKSYYTLNFDLESRENKPKNYKMEFNINNINVISRRNKAQEQCVTDWRNYDEFVLRTMMKESGCHPPQWRETYAWNTSLDLPLCQNTSQMKIFAEQPTIAKIESLMPPCRSIDRLHYHYHEKENNKDYNL